jgi:DNA polymerase/3'-5' exonuclease PolX
MTATDTRITHVSPARLDGDKVRLPWPEAERLAQEHLALLEPACERIVVAGSVRRRKPRCGDVELLAIPKTEPGQRDLFGTPTGEVSELDALVDRLLDAGELTLRADKNGRTAAGGRYKRLWCRGGLFPLDLFVCGRDNWGILLLIRTGSAGFSHYVVTPRLQGGAMPTGMRAEGGRLWLRDKPIETPTEPETFRLLELPYLEPERRTDTVRLKRTAAGLAWHDGGTRQVEMAPPGGLD